MTIIQECFICGLIHRNLIKGRILFGFYVAGTVCVVFMSSWVACTVPGKLFWTARLSIICMKYKTRIGLGAKFICDKITTIGIEENSYLFLTNSYYGP